MSLTELLSVIIPVCAIIVSILMYIINKLSIVTAKVTGISENLKGQRERINDIYNRVEHVASCATTKDEVKGFILEEVQNHSTKCSLSTVYSALNKKN